MDSIPSSGSIVRVKFRISSGLAKVVFMVVGRERSVKSVDRTKISARDSRGGGRHSYLFGRGSVRR